MTARKLEPVSGDGQGAQRATSTAKAAVAVVEARNRLKAFPSVEGTSSLDLRERKACVFRLGSFPLDRLL